ncbi:MAG: hypothetical protein JNJ77_09905 [Planctomycetia bacterium]|nr:hypothetical protein [Planctomycetia bacterium]
MLSKETIEWYRQMTPSERLRLTLIAIRQNKKYLYRGTPEEIVRRFEVMSRKKRESNDALMKGLMEAEARRHEFGY